MSDIYLSIYNNLIKLTRNKNLYNSSKQDTFYDRMIIFFFHLALLLKNYKNIENRNQMQKFFDYCLRQIELSIREIGYGDATINKKMKDYVNILFSIIDKIDSWDLLSDQKKIEIIRLFLDDVPDYSNYLKYFEKYTKYLANNSFNNISKDIITF